MTVLNPQRLLSCALAFASFALPSAAEAQKKLRVALLADHAHDAELAKLYDKAIAEVSSGEQAFQLEVVDPSGRRGDSTAATARAGLDALLADKTIDLIVTLGSLGSAEAVRRGVLQKPVVAAEIFDPGLFDAPKAGTGSGVKNLAYVSDPDALGRDLRAIRALGLSRPALLVGNQVQAGLRTLVERLHQRAQSAGIAGVVIPVDAARPADAIAKLPSTVDGVVLAFTDELPPQAINDLLNAIRGKKLISYSLRGVAQVRAGACAGLADAKDLEVRARRTAMNLVRIAGGEAAASLPFAYPRSESLTINLGAAAAIGWTPPYAVLAEADTVGEEASSEQAGPKLTLRGAAEEVAAQNLDYEANRHQTEAANEDQDQAISYLLPKGKVSLQGVIVDASRAKASFGSRPERELSTVLQAESILFSDQLWANLSIQGKLADLRDLQRDALKLDLVLEGAKGYLNVLQTQVLERVRTDNVKKTRANLAQAKAKSGLGAASPTEVLRWESQLALDQREVLKARALRRLAIMQLNRLRHQPLEERFSTEAEQLEAEMSNISSEALGRYLESEAQFAKLREFLVQEGIAESPELKALDQAVAAADSAAGAALRKVFVPTIAIRGEVDISMIKRGEGSKPAELPPLPPDLAAAFGAIIPPPIDDVVWQIAGVLSLPIPLDLAVFSEIRKADAELAQRQIERDSAREKIEQRIRSAAFQVASSSPGVRLARISAESAKKNLAIAQDAYATGALGVLDVLDAQNLALVAEQNAVAAQYEFMVDQLQLERAVGSFYFLKSKEERDGWLQRFAAYAARPR